MEDAQALRVFSAWNASNPDEITEFKTLVWPRKNGHSVKRLIGV
jgi:hypothetical protein